MNHKEATEDLGKILSTANTEISLCIKDARNHNLGSAIGWLKLADKDIGKAETLLSNMKKAEKKNALKYYHV